MRNRLKRAERALASAEGALLVSLLAVMVVLAFAQVVLRHFGAGLLWGETLLKHLVLWTGFLGAALAAESEKHFAWEAAHLGAPERLKPWLRLVSNLAGAAISAFLLKASWTYFVAERDSASALMTIGSFAVPAHWAAAAIPAGFALIIVHMLFKCADASAELGGAK